MTLIGEKLQALQEQMQDTLSENDMKFSDTHTLLDDARGHLSRAVKLAKEGVPPGARPEDERYVRVRQALHEVLEHCTLISALYDLEAAKT